MNKLEALNLHVSSSHKFLFKGSEGRLRKSHAHRHERRKMREFLKRSDSENDGWD
jgi:hypothetical protein